jgi:predicted nucleotidyltransferase
VKEEEVKIKEIRKNKKNFKYRNRNKERTILSDEYIYEEVRICNLARLKNYTIYTYQVRSVDEINKQTLRSQGTVHC